MAGHRKWSKVKRLKGAATESGKIGQKSDQNRWHSRFILEEDSFNSPKPQQLQNMKTPRSFTQNHVLSHPLGIFFSGIAVFTVAAFTVAAQSDAPKRNANVTGTDLPQSRKQTVQVMVEMSEAPATAIYAEAFKAERAQADAERTFALANPTAPGSQAILQSSKKVEIGSAAKNEVKSHVQKLRQAQDAILPSLKGAQIGGQVLYSVQRAYNGIALAVGPNKISEITKLPGVKAVHPLYPKYPSTTFSDIDFLRARTASPNGGLWTTGGVLGENIKIADIDSGLDYVHTNFGGPGTAAAYASVSDTSPFPNAFVDPTKVGGGFDFVGDAYNANNAATSIPHPDPNPFDGDPSGSSAGHGTATASLIAGFGVNNDGTQYTGTYDATNPVMSNLKVPPGFAPKALLFPLRVFGNSGSTNVVPEAIDWAMDPNGDDDMTDHMDVINMSLGSDEGYPDDPSAVAASEAASIGILVCSAAGNPGDSYYSHSSPAVAPLTLSVAATFNSEGGYVSDSNVTGHAPAAINGTKFGSIKGSASSAIPAGGITGNVVYAVPPNAATDGAAGGTTPLTNATSVAGNIVLINRGTSSFTDKVTKGFAAGAIAVIVNNFTDVPNAFVPITMSTAGQPAGVDVMISHNDRNTIVTAAGGNPANANGSGGATGFNPVTGVPTTPVNVTINNDNGVVSIPALAVPDTVPSYSARGPGLPDSGVKPDLSAPAEVTAVATNRSGSNVRNFNGTSSATPHVAGMMALLRQFHPTWSVQELNALASNTATHNVFTTTAATTQYGVGRIGSGRIDLTHAANANVVAFNGSDLSDSETPEPNLLGVSFGVVETAVGGTSELTKDILVRNKGASPVTYNLTIQNNPALAGASFTFTGPTSITINPGDTATVPVKFTATGSALRHAREASVSSVQGTVFGNQFRHWLTEAAGYAVFTPTAGSATTLRVSLYAAPKPVSAMHTSATNFVVQPGSSGTVQLPLAGTPVNTGAAFPIDIISLVKPFELQYQGVAPSAGADVDPANVLRYVGVMSDFAAVGNQPAATTITFALEGFGNAAVPEFNSSDKEIFIDTNNDRTFDFAIFLSSLANATTTSHTNVYFPFLVNLKTGTATPFLRTNILSPNHNPPPAPQTGRDTNSFNNSAVLIPLPLAALLPAPAQGGGAPTQLRYVVATFDRNGALVDQTPLISYDVAKPGFGLAGGHVEPFLYNDLPATSIPVQFDAKNFKSNGSRGVWLVHMHNGDGLRSDVVPFTTK
jgi:subtilisin family serine protease